MNFIWVDLLNRRFKLGGRDADGKAAPLDCAGVVEVVLIRAGIVSAGEMILPSVYQLAEVEGEIEDFFAALGQRFERIGDHARSCTQAGDFIVTDGADCVRGQPVGVARHLAVLVNPIARTFLTATRGFGVMSMAAWTVAPEHVMGAYRVKPS